MLVNFEMPTHSCHTGRVDRAILGHESLEPEMLGLEVISVMLIDRTTACCTDLAS